MLGGGGGEEWPTKNPKAYFSGTASHIDLKPGTTYRFVLYLRIYNTMDNGGPFLSKGPLKLASQDPFECLGAHEGP